MRYPSNWEGGGVALRPQTAVRACLQIGCPEFCLLVVLLCAETPPQRLRLLYTFKDTLYATFLGGSRALTYTDS